METVYSMAEESYWGVLPPVDWAQGVSAAGGAQGLETSMHLLGSSADDSAPVAALVRYPPDYVLPRHSHDCERLEIVISGSVEVAERQLGPGDIWTTPANVFYGPHQVGPDGCITLELATVAGCRKLTFDTPDGPLEVDFSDPESMAAAAAFIA